MPDAKLKTFLSESNITRGIPITPESMLLEFEKAFAVNNSKTVETHVVLNASDFSTFLTNRLIQDVVDPVTRLDKLRTGYVGRMYNCIIVTDGVFARNLRFITRSEIITTNLGAAQRFMAET